MICYKVKWFHDNDYDPVLLYFELDDQTRLEVRKVDVYQDGKMLHADKTHWTDDVELSWVEVPPLGEINQDKQFDGVEITKDEFEEIWQAAKKQFAARLSD